jgi:two-component system CheB/CheR fusion protein
LLVEDNAGAREMLAGYLELEGLNVCMAKNGIEGIRMFTEFEPEICVVDIGLPDLDGFKVGKRISQESDKRPGLLIALTGYGQEEDRRKVIESGFDIHLVKPVGPEDLVETIAERMCKVETAL